MTGPQDKVALVTGGSSGIGQAIAMGLGDRPILAASRARPGSARRAA